MNEFLNLISDQAIYGYVAIITANYKIAALVVAYVLDDVLARLPGPYPGAIRSLIARFKAGRGL